MWEQIDWVKDVCSSKHGGNEFSVNAWERGKFKATGEAYKILTFIKQCGEKGATADETSVKLGIMLHNTSARFTQLKEARLIHKIGKRKTRSGSWAGVWAAI